MKHAHMHSSAPRARWIWTAVLVLALVAGCAKQRIYTTPPGSEGAVEETVPGGSDESGVTAVPEAAPTQQPAAGSDTLVSEDLPEAPAKAAAPAPAKVTPVPAKTPVAAATPVKAPTSAPAVRSSAQAVQEAQAATYDERGLAARITPDSEDLPTASGDLYDPQAFTAAHRTLPLGSTVRVTNLANGRSTTVRINDRGPFDKARIIDLSQAAAEAIGLTAQGTTEVGLSQTGGPAKAKAPAAAAAAPAAAPAPAATGKAAPAVSKTDKMDKAGSAETAAPAPATEEAAPAVTAATETPVHPAPDAVQAVSGGYWVQVGAFTDKANAERALEGLVRDGYVQSRLVIAPGSGLFRVQAGSFPGEADAQSALARLKTTYPASFLVRD